MAETRFVLLGGRIFPSLLNVLGDADRIDNLVLFASSLSPSKASQFFETLPLDLKSRVTSVRKVEPESYSKSYAEIERAVKEFKTEVSIDVVSSPKIPAFAAWEAARKYGCRIIYTSSTEGKIHEYIFKNGEVAESVRNSKSFTVEEYVRLYGREIDVDPGAASFLLSDVNPEKAFELCRLMVGAMKEEFYRLLYDVREDKSWKELRRLHPSATSKIRKLGLAENPEKIYLTLRFLKGYWMEFYVHRILEGSGLFKNCRHSVRIISGNRMPSNELDFIGVSTRNWLYIAEMKSGRVKDVRKHMDILVSTATLLGGRAVVKYLVLYEFKNKLSPNKLASMMKQAEEREINLLFADDLEENKLVKAFASPRFIPV